MMSNMTYEANDSKVALETYEWDNTWIEQANDHSTPRVLYIGDSISYATRRIVTEAAHGKFLVDGYGSSKALDNPFLFDSIRMFAAQEGRRSAIIVNNGLHGWHLEDSEEYGALYDKLIAFLLEEFKGTPVFAVLTTSVRNPEREERVKVRNAAALAVAEKYGIGVIDLYSISAENHELWSDGVHFQRECYEKFAKYIVECLENI
jgi:hypothetical protein